MKICCIGYRKWSIAIYKKLEKSGYDILILKKVDKEKLMDINPKLVLFYGWSEIIDKEIVNEFTCIMLHPSPLPKYRGGSPIQNQIIRGQNKSAVTLFIMDEGIDTGDIIAQEFLSLEYIWKNHRNRIQINKNNS